MFSKNPGSLTELSVLTKEFEIGTQELDPFFRLLAVVWKDLVFVVTWKYKF